MNILCWLWPLLAGLICGILGYLLGKSLVKEWRDKYNRLQEDLDACKKERIGLESELKVAKASSSSVSVSSSEIDGLNARISGLQADLSAKESKNIDLQNELNALKADFDANANVSSSLTADASADLDSWKQRVNSLEANLKATQDTKARLEDDLNKCLSARVKLESDLKSASLASASVALLPFDADAAKAAYGKKIKQDDLKIVEGIGPKIEGLFHNHGIKTWKALGEASIEKCQEVLDSGGERYRIHNPSTWPQQAQLAYEGKWAELVKWQDELDGGKA